MPTQTRPAPDRSRFQVQTITKQALLAGGQLLVAGVVAIVWETIANALGWTEYRQFPLAPAGPQILNACLIAALGFCSALLVARLPPHFCRCWSFGYGYRQRPSWLPSQGGTFWPPPGLAMDLRLVLLELPISEDGLYRTRHIHLSDSLSDRLFSWSSGVYFAKPEGRRQLK